MDPFPLVTQWVGVQVYRLIVVLQEVDCDRHAEEEGQHRELFKPAKVGHREVESVCMRVRERERKMERQIS